MFHKSAISGLGEHPPSTQSGLRDGLKSLSASVLLRRDESALYGDTESTEALFFNSSFFSTRTRCVLTVFTLMVEHRPRSRRPSCRMPAARRSETRGATVCREVGLSIPSASAEGELRRKRRRKITPARDAVADRDDQLLRGAVLQYSNRLAPRRRRRTAYCSSMVQFVRMRTAIGLCSNLIWWASRSRAGADRRATGRLRRRPIALGAQQVDRLGRSACPRPRQRCPSRPRESASILCGRSQCIVDDRTRIMCVLLWAAVLMRGSRREPSFRAELKSIATSPAEWNARVRAFR